VNRVGHTALVDLQEKRRADLGNKEEVELQGPAKPDSEARRLDFVSVRTQVELQEHLFFPVEIEPSTLVPLHMLFFSLCIVFAPQRFCVESERLCLPH